MTTGIQTVLISDVARDHHAATTRRGQPTIRGLRRAGVVGGAAVTGTRPLGPLVHSFFCDHLVTVKGLRPSSVRSYRDTIRLLLCFAAADKKTKITKLNVEDLTFEQMLGFLRYLEVDFRTLGLGLSGVGECVEKRVGDFVLLGVGG